MKKLYSIVFIFSLCFKVYAIFNFRENIEIEDYLIDIFTKDTLMVVCSNNGTTIYDLTNETANIIDSYYNLSGNQYLLNDNNLTIRDNNSFKEYNISNPSNIEIERSFNLNSNFFVDKFDVYENVLAISYSSPDGNNEFNHLLNIFEITDDNLLILKESATFHTINQSNPKLFFNKNKMLFYTFYGENLDLVFDCNDINNIHSIEENINNLVTYNDNFIVFSQAGTINVHNLNEDGISYNSVPVLQITNENNNQQQFIIEKTSISQSKLFVVLQRHDQFLIKSYSLSNFEYIGEYSILKKDFSLTKGVLESNDIMIITGRTKSLLVEMNQDPVDDFLWVLDISSDDSVITENYLRNRLGETLYVINSQDGEIVNTHDIPENLSLSNFYFFMNENYFISIDPDTDQFFVYKNYINETSTLYKTFNLSSNPSFPIYIDNNAVHFMKPVFSVYDYSNQQAQNTFQSLIEPTKAIYLNNKIFLDCISQARKYLYIYDNTNSLEPTFLERFRINDEELLTVNNTHIYTFTNSGNIRIYNYTNIENIYLEGESEEISFNSYSSVQIENKILYLSHPSENSISILDVNNPKNLKIMKIFKWNHTIKKLHLYENRLIFPSYYGITCLNTNLVSNEEIIKPVKNNCLKQNYPNPFFPNKNNSTRIDFKLKKSKNTKLKIYNINGQLVKEISEIESSKGENYIIWDGTNNKNKKVPTGIYFYSLFVENKLQDTKKCIILK